MYSRKLLVSVYFTSALLLLSRKESQSRLYFSVVCCCCFHWESMIYEYNGSCHATTSFHLEMVNTALLSWSWNSSPIYRLHLINKPQYQQINACECAVVVKCHHSLSPMAYTTMPHQTTGGWKRECQYPLISLIGLKMKEEQNTFTHVINGGTKLQLIQFYTKEWKATFRKPFFITFNLIR